MDRFQKAAEFAGHLGKVAASSLNKRAGLFYKDIEPKPVLLGASLPMITVNGINGKSDKAWPAGLVRTKEPRLLTRLFTESPEDAYSRYINHHIDNSVFDDIVGALDHVRAGRKFNKSYSFGDYAALLAAQSLNKDVASGQSPITGLEVSHNFPKRGGPKGSNNPTKELISLGIPLEKIYKLEENDDPKAVTKYVDKKFGEERRVKK